VLKSSRFLLKVLLMHCVTGIRIVTKNCFMQVKPLVTLVLLFFECEGFEKEGRDKDENC